jgi:hypothetical protein
MLRRLSTERRCELWPRLFLPNRNKNRRDEIDPSLLRFRK